MILTDFDRLLLALYESHADFILVGGLAAVLQGAPIQTYDVDIVYSRKLDNVACLLAVLADLDAIFRVQPERRIRPNESHLLGSGHLNLLTRFGPLDLLARIGEGLTYEDLLPHSREVRISENAEIKLLNLEFIIRLKESLGGEKDAASLPALRQTLRETKKRGD